MSDLYETVNAILWVVIYIAAGSTAALIFIIIFTQSITGSKIIHKQMKSLENQMHHLNSTLQDISKKLDNSEKKQSDSD
jgi:hypothetical protein